MPAPLWKGEHHKVTRHKQRAAIRTDAKSAKVAAKKRDEWRCRWPRADHDTPNHVCIGQLESAHQVPIGMGGDKDGTRTCRAELITVCHWIHQASPEAIERHGRTWEGLTGREADGPVIFSRKVRQPSGGSWEWVEVARERSIGQLEP